MYVSCISCNNESKTCLLSLCPSVSRSHVNVWMIRLWSFCLKKSRITGRNSADYFLVHLSGPGSPARWLRCKYFNG